jgi:hypothetical protein
LDSRKTFQPPPLYPPVLHKQLGFDRIESPVGLFWSQHRQTNRTRYQVSQLQTSGILFLVRKHYLKVQLLAIVVCAIADSAEFQLQFIVFVLAAFLYNDMHSWIYASLTAIRSG